MNNNYYVIHSAEGSTWSKKNHKYIKKEVKNGKTRYYYKDNNKPNKEDYNWFEDWWGKDEYNDYALKTLRYGAAKENLKSYEDYLDRKYGKGGRPLNSSSEDSIKYEQRKQDYQKYGLAYLESKDKYYSTPKGKVEKFIDKGKAFLDKIFKRKSK